MSSNKLSKYFTLREATVTNTGIDNSPDPGDLEVILWTASNMDKVRELLGTPCLVNSWYRNSRVNKAVGGVENSQHRRGEAVDFRSPSYGSPFKICKAIQDSTLDFDQLILEPTWVHISFTQRHKQRRQVLTLSGAGKYVQGLRV